MKRFKKAYVEITNVCNLDCRFCKKTRRPRRFMTTGEFSHILCEITPYTNYVYLHLTGEPLLHPELETVLSLCGSSGIRVNITTNGTLIKKCDSILAGSRALRKIGFSLHGAADNSQIDLEEYLSNVAYFLPRALHAGILCELRLWNIGGGQSRNEFMLDFLSRALAVEFPPAESLAPSKSVTLSPGLFLVADKKFEWPDISLNPLGEAVFCYALRDQFGILADGTVVPCCLDSEGDINLGNIFETPLEHILSTRRAKSLYDGFSQRRAVEALCSRCGFARRF